MIGCPAGCYVCADNGYASTGKHSGACCRGSACNSGSNRLEEKKPAQRVAEEVLQRGIENLRRMKFQQEQAALIEAEREQQRQEQAARERVAEERNAEIRAAAQAREAALRERQEQTQRDAEIRARAGKRRVEYTPAQPVTPQKVEHQHRERVR